MKRCLCVLVVEDDRVLGPLTRYALEALGHKSVLSVTSHSTYGYLTQENHPFEAILLDLQLDYDRSEPLIERLRAEGFLLPPIVVFSAQPTDDLVRAVQRTGAKSFIQKPAAVDDIEKALAAAVA
jgi:DNA-binding response OmpR family regulator